MLLGHRRQVSLDDSRQLALVGRREGRHATEDCGEFCDKRRGRPLAHALSSNVSTGVSNACARATSTEAFRLCCKPRSSRETTDGSTAAVVANVC
jgi:hypothetical protein